MASPDLGSSRQRERNQASTRAQSMRDTLSDSQKSSFQKGRASEVSRSSSNSSVRVTILAAVADWLFVRT